MSAIAAGKGYLPTGHVGVAGNHARALSGGEIAAIAVAVVVVTVLLGALAVCCLRRWRRKRRAARARALEQGPPPRVPRSPRRRQDPAASLGGRGEEGQHAGDVPEQPGAIAGRGDGCRLGTTAYDLEAGEGPHTLDCGDSFHLRCIRRWMQHNLSCPLCNATQIALLGLGDTDGEALRPRLRCSTSYGALDRGMSKDDIDVGRSSSFGA